MRTQQIVGTIFFGISAFFLVVSFRDYLRSKGKKSIARKTWLRLAVIFAAVGIVLYFL
ncbi:MAG TPA: hypothetical protein VFF47_01340 [Nitrospirota bacterium]|nr:hypothetical protein [Nitrospirota bacterium]